MTSQSALPAYADLEPSAVWRFFAAISEVPRPSKKEERIRAAVRRMAEERKLPVREDAAGNLVIEAPATPGREKAPVVVLQGHLDMVCEKNRTTEHDFDRDPIRLAVDRDATEGRVIVRAEGTTLGADNGIGVALALAAATSRDVVHGPLEVLCTVDEEMGMGGAKALTPDFLRGRLLLNLDCEDAALYVGCAGGCDATLTWSFPPASGGPAAEVSRVSVTGLRGGHSGVDIHQNHANAVRVLARMLAGTTASGAPVPPQRLIQFEAGSRRNAIAREAFALTAGPAGSREILRGLAEEVRAELIGAGETNCRIEVEATDATRSAALSEADSARVLRAILGLPHGVLAMVPEMPGLVQTSNNVATAQLRPTEDGRLNVTVGCMARSSVLAQAREVVAQIQAVGELAGAEVTAGNPYPGWRPNVNSPLLAVCRSVFKQVHGREPEITAIHAGLECGIIGDRVPGMDMISFGPDIRGAHSPDERVFVDSVQRTWEYLRALLIELAKI